MTKQQLATLIATLLPNNTTRQISEQDMRDVLNAILSQTGEEVETNLVVAGKTQIDLSNPHGTVYTTPFAGAFEFVNPQPGGKAYFTHADLIAPADPASSKIFGVYDEQEDANYYTVLCEDSTPPAYRVWIQQAGAITGGGGTTDHGALTGLNDDDHPQYYNQSRGDARYSQIGHTHTRIQDADNTTHIDVSNAETAKITALVTHIDSSDTVIGYLAGTQLTVSRTIPNMVARLGSRIVMELRDLTQHIGDYAGVGNSVYLLLEDAFNRLTLSASTIRLTGYLNTRNDGTATKALYTDASGNLRLGTLPAGTTDHGALTGLGDDDHPQYHNNTRGDARYSQLAHTHAQLHDATVLGTKTIDETDYATGRPIVAAGPDGMVYAPVLDLGTVTVLTDGATITLDAAVSRRGRVTLGGNRTLAISNATAGCEVIITVIQDGTGSRSISTFPASSLLKGGALTFSTAAGAKDVLTGYYDGVNWFWNISEYE